MLDIGWQELFIVGIVLLIVVKPKDIPDVIVTVRQYIDKLRGFSREFHSTVDDLVRESQLHEMKDAVEQQGKDLMGELDHDMADFDVDEWLDKPIMPEKTDKKPAKKPVAKKATVKKKTAVKKTPQNKSS